MNSSVSNDENPTSFSAIEKIDVICDRFELEMRRGSRPKIEDYLPLHEEPSSDRLLRDLVAIDFEFSPLELDHAFSEYFRRFPDAIQTLEALRRDFELSPRRLPVPPPTARSDQTTMDSPPLQIRHFKLMQIAGTGGFGTVWRAMDLQLQREVAVKIPRIERTSSNDLSSVMREARFSARLRHPNIVTVYEVGEDSGKSFIVTDYIDGKNLKDWKRNRTINFVDAARLVAKVAVAIEHAHTQGIIHRDLKLANVMMDRSGEPHITDFGLVKRETLDDSISIEGRVLGTPAYMAPEQARADHDHTDRRTDIYSLGVILYELLTGRTPYRGETQEVLQQIMSDPPAPPRSIKPEIPRDLEAVCLKCLAKDSFNRYGSAQALADDLHLFLNGESLRGIPAPLPNRVWKWINRRRKYVATAMIAAALVAGISTGLMALWFQPTKASAPVSPVSIVTDPPGCEITAVAIDPETGEPNPARIQKAQGRTPLTMSLAGGDYLIVAVLDAHRFHEVYRHVPQPNESIPLAYLHLGWRRSKSGVIEVPRIKIPRPDVTVEMGFCEGTDSLDEPSKHTSVATTDTDRKDKWQIPPFFVDCAELSKDRIKELHGQQIRLLNSTDEEEHVRLNYYSAIYLAELEGKRLPSAAELYYLTNTVCPGSGDEKDVCDLKDHRTIEGLHSNVWEWTSTKPGGPFSGSTSVPILLGSTAASQVVGGSSVLNREMSTFSGFKTLTFLEKAGFRGVRSAGPRVSPKDFVTKVD